MAQSNVNFGANASIPAAAGIGLRAPHFAEMLQGKPAIGWLEVHSENYFIAGGAPLFYLDRLRVDYPISLHGVGMSLGSYQPLDRQHLHQLKRLIDRVQPALVSEHLSWNAFGGLHFPDLLPLPYTEEALQHMIGRVQQVQELLGRQILIENPSSYLQYQHSTLSEAEFLSELVRHSGCGLLLDINNIYVSCCNHGWDAQQYLQQLPVAVQEIHLAGHSVNRVGQREVLIDTHNQPVAEAVWALYRTALLRFGPLPTLIEWDADIPPLAQLLAEADRADRYLEHHHACAA